MKPQTFPTLQQMAANLAVEQGSIEVVKWELFDYGVYPTAGLALMQFFIAGQGNGLSASPGNVGAVKTFTDTNLTGAGVLPAPQAFYTEEIEVCVDPGSSGAANNFSLQIPGAFIAVSVATLQAGAHDVNAILSSGSLQFNVSQKPYYQAAPLYRVPPTTRMQLDCDIGTTSATTAEVVKEKLYATGTPAKLDPGIGIMTAQNFSVNLVWPVVVATPSGFNARIGVILSGWLFRGVQ